MVECGSMMFAIALLILFFVLFLNYHRPIKKSVFRRVPAQNNWNGVPKPGLTWDEVANGTEEISPIIPMILETMPASCPICEGSLEDYKSAWMKFNSGGQYNVIGKYCAKGHWTHLDCA